MADNPFDSAKLLLDRAREHREELSRRSKAFFDDNPYTTVVEFDSHSGLYIRYARLPHPLPPSLFPVAADAFNNLRHALDQAVCASALAKDPSVDLDGVGFSFGKNPTEFRKKFRTTRSKIAPDIETAIAGFEPYKRGNGHVGGDNQFCALNELCRTNKHRVLIALKGGIKQMNINTATVWRDAPFLLPVWDSAKGELIAGAADHPDKLNYDLGLTFSVVIGDIDGIRDWPALGAFDLLSDKVRTVLRCLET
jgi:hypothetical protein